MPEGLTIQCKTCGTELFWPTKGFELNVIGAIQMQCRTCNQVALAMPAGSRILGMKDEGQEELINRLMFSKDDEPPKTSAKKKPNK